MCGAHGAIEERPILYLAAPDPSSFGRAGMSFSGVQIKVRCSVRATSLDCCDANNSLGRFFVERLGIAFAEHFGDDALVFSEDPSQYTTRSGLVSRAASSTQFSSGVPMLLLREGRRARR